MSEPTNTEALEALRRAIQADPVELTDAEILAGLRANVAKGLMEESVGTDGQPAFKMTPAGEEWARTLIKGQGRS